MGDLRLIVALGVGDGLLAVAAVGEGEGEVADVPFVIGRFLQELEVHVGDCHREAVVEADTS